jgi:hypothetical protein
VVSEIRSFQVTIPAGTAQTSPAITDVSFPPRVVTGIHWKVPPGPSGLMGWALTIDGNPVIPRAQGTYIVADNDSDTWTLEGYPDQGQWQLTGYNTDIYDHTVYLDFLLDQIATELQTPAQLPNAAISSPPAAVQTSAAPLITAPPVSV